MEQDSHSPSVGIGNTPVSKTQMESHPSASNTPNTVPKSLPSKRTGKSSDVWDHFKVYKDDKNKSRAICNYCEKDYAGGTRLQGTSTLRNHLMTQCSKYPYRLEDKKQKILCFKKITNVGSESSGGSNLVAVGFNQDACRLACTKMIIIDELSFRFVEQEGFKLFCSVACPRFVIPSRITIARDIMKLYYDEKKQLRDYLVKSSQRVSLTTDTWTSIQNVCYMVLTSHFIDFVWKMQKRILNFIQIANHKGETIDKAIEACLKDWGIDRVFTITVDNAASNGIAISHIKKRLHSWKTVVCDGEFLHMRCSAHILNLVVNDGLKELDDSIATVRNAIRYVRASPSRLARFQSCVKNTTKQEKALVCLDVATRWNSTFLMLDSALKFVEGFKLLEEEDGFYMQYFIDEDRNGKSLVGPPNSIDWDNCIIFCRFLKVFYEATLRFSASLFVTSNTYFHEVCAIRGKLIKWCSSEKSVLQDMAVKMKLKFDKYWGNVEKQNMLLYVAVILDPRYKLKFVLLCLNKLYTEKEVDGMITRVKDCLSKLVSHYSNEQRLKNPESNNSQSGVSNQDSGKMVDSDDDSDMFESEFDKECDEDEALDTKNELDRYFLERNEDRKNKDFDILAWWKMNATKYPILSEMACDVLAIQVSTVASESAFSTGGRVLDSFRSSLSPSMVQALICTQNWIRASSLPLDMGSILEDIETFQSMSSDTSGASEIVDIE